MEQDIVQHDNALSTWIAVRVSRDGTLTKLLRVETDLSLNVDDPNYRSDALSSLVEVAITCLRQHPDVDSIELEQSRQGGFEVTRIGD
ncbi:MAG: hypothetical protein ACM3L9_00095 [Deltaproteobacteria bacterium]